MAMKTPRYALSNPLSLLLDKPAADFTRADLLKVIESKGIERITFHYLAIDGKLKETDHPGLRPLSPRGRPGRGRAGRRLVPVQGHGRHGPLGPLRRSPVPLGVLQSVRRGQPRFRLPLPDPGRDPGALHAGQHPGPGRRDLPQGDRPPAQRPGRARVLPADQPARPVLPGRGPARLPRLGAVHQERPHPPRDGRPHRPRHRGGQVRPQRERRHRRRPQRRRRDRRAAWPSSSRSSSCPGRSRTPADDLVLGRWIIRNTAFRHGARGHLHAQARGGRRRERACISTWSSRRTAATPCAAPTASSRSRPASSSAGSANTPIP
ncbi:MAG: hypothetical protein M0C28_03240 [Candidatus Moduliflexus flocculans]|nr:hypothetical protein [Candidatus Moduliflexus flocculans]